MTVPRGLRPQELEAVYAISRAIAQAVDIDAALNQIVKLTRPVFIFDNVVLYHEKGEQLNPSYARLIGRGRATQPDLTWDDTVAQETFACDRSLVYEEKLPGWEQDRLKWRTYLGLPLHTTQGKVGALVFGRFGGPLYTPDQVRLAEFIASHISQLLEHQKLVEQIAQLEAERRLRKLQEDFIANVSHELHTPLGFIKGYATTLLREDASWDSATRREFLKYIDEEADRLGELISALLDSSRLQAGTMPLEFRPVSMEQLLKVVITRSHVRYPGLKIGMQVPEDHVVQADPPRLTQVFDNMINNAVKYAPGSEILLSTELINDQVHIRVTDHGPGIAPEHLVHLFERFYRVPHTRDRVHGSGLGLYICRQIVLAHQGEMKVESQLATGTTFHVYLPVHDEKQPITYQQEEN
jgi:K+-sensing histidine kinase KdpD